MWLFVLRVLVLLEDAELDFKRLCDSLEKFESFSQLTNIGGKIITAEKNFVELAFLKWYLFAETKKSGESLSQHVFWSKVLTYGQVS